jgi:hypothetical protein
VPAARGLGGPAAVALRFSRAMVCGDHFVGGKNVRKGILRMGEGRAVVGMS